MVSHRTSRRRGFSLVELVAVIIAGSALMGVTISVLVAIQRADQRFTRRVDQRQAMDLLADQLRRDVHAAQRATWNSAANELTLETPEGGCVAYRRSGRRWERRASGGADQQPQLAGAFRLPAGAKCTVEPAVVESGALVRIAWTVAAQPRDALRTAPPRYELTVVVGRDFALLHQDSAP